MEKIMPKKITARLTDSTEQFYARNFRNKTGGAEFVLDAFPVLYKRALADLRGKFSPGEISLMLDAFNSTFVDPRQLGQHLELCASDSMALERTDEKWGVDPPVFIAKIRGLTFFERACLEIFVRAFWESGEWEKSSTLAWISRIC